jgi:hypothetical protein
MFILKCIRNNLQAHFDGTRSIMTCVFEHLIMARFIFMKNRFFFWIVCLSIFGDIPRKFLCFVALKPVFGLLDLLPIPRYRDGRFLVAIERGSSFLYGRMLRYCIDRRRVSVDCHSRTSRKVFREFFES